MNNEQYYVNTDNEEKETIQTMNRFLGLEHFGWKFGAVFGLIMCIVMACTGVIMTVVGASALSSINDQQTMGLPAATAMAMGITYTCTSLMCLVPVTVINFMMIKKVEYYESTLYTDISIARRRCTSVGMIVFCVIFNELAAVFFIINFAKTRKRAEIFDRIEAEQKGTL